ncbi:hypothetical protein LXA43DRAFT_50311 [Ganoderma leucocontextum]|nr:hypothetical protein LXA43DRAFT_50311 [Ganoderma leucocontextum]
MPLLCARRAHRFAFLVFGSDIGILDGMDVEAWMDWIEDLGLCRLLVLYRDVLLSSSRLPSRSPSNALTASFPLHNPPPSVRSRPGSVIVSASRIDSPNVPGRSSSSSSNSVAIRSRPPSLFRRSLFLALCLSPRRRVAPSHPHLRACTPVVGCFSFCVARFGQFAPPYLDVICFSALFAIALTRRRRLTSGLCRSAQHIPYPVALLLLFY